MEMHMEVLVYLNPTYFFLKYAFLLVTNLTFQQPKANSKNEHWEVDYISLYRTFLHVGSSTMR